MKKKYMSTLKTFQLNENKMMLYFGSELVKIDPGGHFVFSDVGGAADPAGVQTGDGEEKTEHQRRGRGQQPISRSRKTPSELSSGTFQSCV